MAATTDVSRLGSLIEALVENVCVKWLHLPEKSGHEAFAQ